MSAQAIIRRYKRIIDILESGQYPSMDGIMDYIERIGLKASQRTIERDFEVIRNEFDVEIEYNPSKRGYFIIKRKVCRLTIFFACLNWSKRRMSFRKA